MGTVHSHDRVDVFDQRLKNVAGQGAIEGRG
jgi:hypothetical protein